MGVYIKGMKMPTDHPLWIVVHSDGTVEVNEVSPSRPVGWQTLRNAAVSVPPHGRLIDADALKPYMLNEHYKYRRVYDADEIANAPTIIPAEEGE